MPLDGYYPLARCVSKLPRTIFRGMCEEQIAEAPPSRHFRNLGKALVLIREMRRKSQRAIARASGASTSQLSKYETGRTLPKLETVERILDVLNVAPLDLFYLVTLVDEWESRLDEGGGQRVVIPGGGLLTSPILGASRQIIESLFTIQAEFVSARMNGVREGQGEGALEEEESEGASKETESGE